MRNGLRTLTAILLLATCSVQMTFAQFEYIFPPNGTKNEYTHRPMILRNGAQMDPASITSDKITINGSITGTVEATVVLAADGKTICIKPLKDFAYTETVTVNVADGFKTLSGQILTGTSFSFSIRREMTPQEKQDLQNYLSTHDEDGNLLVDPNQKSTYVPFDNSTRTNHFSFVNIYTNNNPAPGDIFFHRNSGASPTASSGIGYGIMTSAGDSVFYRPSLVDGANFHINLDGYLTALRLDPNVDTTVIIMDSSYNIIGTAGPAGYTPSQHEQLFYPNGDKWYTVYDWQAGWDLSSFGGPQSSTVNVSRIVEMNGNNLIFEWSAADHFAVTDAAPDILLTIGASTYDPWHLNAMFLDNDNKIVASFRNMDRIVKINSNSNGAIAWHWGGMNSTYTDITTTSCNGFAFSHQHNVHRIANGHILMFDNGNGQPATNRSSQPKEFSLDETNLTATCVWFYQHPQVNGFNIFTKNQGSAERLPNGNTIIGYGLPDVQGLPNGAEIDVNKNIVWEFRFKDSTEYTYRVYKYEWSPNVGIADVNNGNNNLAVFPNPADGLFNISVELPSAAKSTITVTNLLGQVVYSKTETMTAGTNNATLDLTATEKGFYFLEVKAGKSRMVDRILVQ
jgi:hypothetical protein